MLDKVMTHIQTRRLTQIPTTLVLMEMLPLRP